MQEITEQKPGLPADAAVGLEDKDFAPAGDGVPEGPGQKERIVHAEAQRLRPQPMEDDLPGVDVLADVAGKDVLAIPSTVKKLDL